MQKWTLYSGRKFNFERFRTQKLNPENYDNNLLSSRLERVHLAPSLNIKSSQRNVGPSNDYKELQFESQFEIHS